MDRDTVIKQIEATLGEVLEEPVTECAEDTRLFEDLHLDSTSILEVLMGLEDSVGVEVDPEKLEMADFRSVGSLADYLLRNLPVTLAD